MSFVHLEYGNSKLFLGDCGEQNNLKVKVRNNKQPSKKLLLSLQKKQTLRS